MPPEPDDLDDLEEEQDDPGSLALRIAERREDDQTARFQGLLARLPITAALISVIVGFSAIAFALLARDPAPHQLSLGAATLIVFLLSVGCTTVAMQKNLTQRGPDPEQVLFLERSASPKVARAWIIEQMVLAYEVNEPVVDSTRRWAQAAQLGAFTDVLLAVATVMSVLFA